MLSDLVFLRYRGAFFSVNVLSASTAMRTSSHCFRRAEVEVVFDSGRSLLSESRCHGVAVWHQVPGRRRLTAGVTVCNGCGARTRRDSRRWSRELHEVDRVDRGFSALILKCVKPPLPALRSVQCKAVTSDEHRHEDRVDDDGSAGATWNPGEGAVGSSEADRVLS